MSLASAAAAIVVVAVSAGVAGCGSADAEAEGPTRADLLSTVEAAAHVTDPLVRAEVVRMAGLAESLELEEVLRDGARDPDPLVRAAALEAQLRSGREVFDPIALYEQLVEGDEAARRTAFDLVLRYGTPAQRAEVVGRALRHNSAGFRRFAFRRMVSAQDASAAVPPETLARVFDEDPTLAAEVVELLRRNGQVGALEPVHRRLLSQEPDERLAALRILAITPSLDCWPQLRWARAHGSDEERRLAVLALARLGDQSAAEELQTQLRAGDETLIPLALRALAGLGGSDTVRQVAAYRTDTRVEVRHAAMRALLALEAPAEELVGFIEDSDPEIAAGVSAALARADAGELAGRVCPQLRLRQSPVALLRFLWLVSDARESGALNEACAAQLQALLRSESPDVRALAARLYYAVTPPDPAGYAGAAQEPPEVLYAWLESTLRGDPASYEATYRGLLQHNLLIVRVLAAVGLLAGGSA